MLFLEFGPARFFNSYQKQILLSLGSDDTVDMEPWCTYTAIFIEVPRNPIDNQLRQSKVRLKFLWGESNGQK